MPKITLIYFNHCPNIERARKAITESGVKEFLEVSQDQLPENHPFRQYSSPTILVDEKVVAGSNNSATACSIIQWGALSNEIKNHLAGK